MVAEYNRAVYVAKRHGYFWKTVLYEQKDSELYWDKQVDATALEIRPDDVFCIIWRIFAGKKELGGLWLQSKWREDNHCDTKQSARTDQKKNDILFFHYGMPSLDRSDSSWQGLSHPGAAASCESAPPKGFKTNTHGGICCLTKV